jgi:hypothetical protein
MGHGVFVGSKKNGEWGTRFGTLGRKTPIKRFSSGAIDLFMRISMSGMNIGQISIYNILSTHSPGLKTRTRHSAGNRAV